MPTRRQEKVARVVMRAVSEAITLDLSDPRVTGLVSVTRVEMSPDLRNADVYLSVLGQTPGAEQRAFEAIEHARRYLQARVAREVTGKFCPVIHLHRDDHFKKTLGLMNLIDQAAAEYPSEPEGQATQNEDDPGTSHERQ